MTEPKSYKSAKDFRVALEHRLQKHAADSGLNYLPEEVETAVEADLLGFAGVSPAAFPMLPREVQFAEKLHAYTMPRSVPNSRVRDLVDMVLLIQEGKSSPGKVRAALKAVFARRKSHDVPAVLEPAPDRWVKSFAEMAEECSLEIDLNEGFEILRRFYSKVV
ncbi:MAG: nucleotidyl transferase AbiEii/AbiGii toxin family protein [Elusimicrobiota bacterium]|nr:nucleotidyl transferase AbiEii/AbiGii toxin family protein [Elusimicrobiota bacterium]